MAGSGVPSERLFEVKIKRSSKDMKPRQAGYYLRKRKTT